MGRKRTTYAPSTTGVYIIWNKKTFRFYLGSATNLYVRFKSHKSRLKNNYHTNPELQADYNLYGLDALEFIILEEFSCLEDARACEKNLIEEFAYKNLLYNLDHTGKGNAKTGKPRPPFSEEWKARISAAKVGKRFSDEHKAAMSAGQKLAWAKRRQASVDEPLTCASV